MQHFIFAVSYAYYVMFYLSTGEKISAPLIAAPVLIYAALALTCLVLSRIMRADFTMFFKRISPALYFSLVLFLAPIAVKFRIPDPHNFTLRKLELILAAAYVLNLAFMAFKSFSYLYRSGAVQRVKAKKAFVYLASVYFIFFFFLTLRFNQANEPTGDEPAYLMTAHSIVHDRDLDIANNFADKDYKRFYSRELVPQPSDVFKDGKHFSYHPVLVSFAIAPFYAALGRNGATILTAFAAAASAALLYIVTFILTGDRRASFIASVITSFTMPFIAFINMLSTEMASLLFVLASYTALKKEKFNVWLFSLFMGLLFWVHVRNIPLYGSLGLLFLIYNIKKPGRLALFALAQGVIIAGYFALNYARFGGLFPSYASEGGAMMSRFSFDNIRGALVLLLDSQQGLLFYAPVFIVSLAGLMLMADSRKKELTELAVLFLPLFMLVTSWDDWGSGSSSPRYLMPVIFVFTAGLGMVISRAVSAYLKKPVEFLALVSFLVTAVIAVVPWFRWAKSGGENWILSVASKAAKFDINALFPDYNTGPLLSGVSVVWLISCAVITAAVYFMCRRNRKAGDM